MNQTLIDQLTDIRCGIQELLERAAREHAVGRLTSPALDALMAEMRVAYPAVTNARALLMKSSA